MIRNCLIASLCIGCALFVFATAHVGAEPTQEKRPQAPSVKLEDQYGATHEYTFPRERVLLVTISGKKGSKDMDRWLETLHETYDGKIDFQGIADLSMVPYLAHKLARLAIRNKTKDPVLCDWSGEVCQGFGADSAVANVLVVSPSGHIYHHAKGPMTDAALNVVRAAIDCFLVGDSNPDPNATAVSQR